MTPVRGRQRIGFAFAIETGSLQEAIEYEAIVARGLASHLRLKLYYTAITGSAYCRQRIGFAFAIETAIGATC